VNVAVRANLRESENDALGDAGGTDRATDAVSLEPAILDESSRDPLAAVIEDTTRPELAPGRPV
jgi:hypothetical protein